MQSRTQLRIPILAKEWRRPFGNSGAKFKGVWVTFTYGFSTNFVVSVACDEPPTHTV